MIDLDTTIVLSQVAAGLYLTGVIWFLQLVHYPLLKEIDTYGRSAYEFTHLRLATWSLGPPMLVELAGAAWLLWRRPAYLPDPFNWANAGLLAIIWGGTLLQASKHQILAIRFNEQAHRNLVRSNWWRTAAWTLRAGLWLYLLQHWMTLNA